MILAGLLLIPFGIATLFGTISFAKENKRESEKKTKEANKLYKCSSCNKLARRYQVDLYKEAHGQKGCPHCKIAIQNTLEKWMYNMGRSLPEKCSSHIPKDKNCLIIVDTEDQWMETHPDCPKLSIKQFKDIKKTIQTIKKNKEDQAAHERFMKYNNLKTDFSWVDNLNKNQSGSV